MLQAAIDQTQQVVNGVVRLKLYKGNVLVVGRKSETNSLFDESIATFEEDAGRLRPGRRHRLHPAQRPAPARGGTQKSLSCGRIR